MSISKKPVLVIYLRFCIGDSEEQILELDLVELADRGSETVAQAVEDSLLKAGFTRDFLKEYWVEIVADGASVMLGKHSGVATRLKKRFPKVLVWHCLNHRLELSVDDVIKSMKAVNNFQKIMDMLYSHFSASTKNQQELEQKAAELAVQLRRIGRVLGVRWVASSHCEVCIHFTPRIVRVLHRRSRIRGLDS